MNNKLKELYKVNFINENHYVYGGAINEKTYNLQEIKLLFILKESIDESNNEIWSLVDLVNKQIADQKFLTVWKRIGELSYGFYNKFPSYYNGVINKHHNSHIAEGLNKIAVINLKKTGGRNQSDMSIIREHAFRNKELLLSEFNILKPNILVCGGNFDLVRDVFEIEDTISKSGARIGKLGNLLFIDFVHPGYYMLSPKIMYAYFKEVISQL